MTGVQTCALPIFFRVSGEIMADPRSPTVAPADQAPVSLPAPTPQAPPPAQPVAPPPVVPQVPEAPPASARGLPGGPVVPAQPAASPPSQPAATPGAAPFAGRPVVPPAAPAAPPTRPAPRPATGAPINPFLSQDPNQKARRLARALVSDLVVYHPGKRQEGLRNGTLKELFDDEIKKSWEEYTDQIGTDVAGAANYFNDALNEILSDGHKIF